MKNCIIRNILLMLALLLVLLAWVAGLFTDLTGDAGLYAAISRQMCEAGDWLHLTINGRSYDQKPHLLFWLAGAGISLFGNSNAAFKLFAVIAGISGILFTYQLGNSVSGKTTGRIAALIAGTSQIVYLYLHDIHTDTVLFTAVALSMWQFTEYLRNRRSRNFVLAFIATGLAMMTKGPVGAVIPFFFVVIYLFLTKNYRLLFHPRWLLGVALAVMVISPALYHLYEKFGMAGLRFYFIDNNLGRVTGSVAGSNRDLFYYLHNFLWALLPFTVPVIAGLYFQIRKSFKQGFSNPFTGALLGSFLVMLLILSIARGKAPNYMLILLPVAAVLAAGWLKELPVTGSRIIRRMILWQNFLLALLFLLIPLSALVVKPLNLWLPGAGIAVAMVLNLFFRKVEKEPVFRVVYLSVVVSAVLNIYLNVHVLPHLYSFQGARQALQLYEGMRGENGMLKNLHLEEYELFFWAKAPVEDFTTWEEFYEYLKGEDRWVYTNGTGLKVVEELTSATDTVIAIPQAGMNRVTLRFLLPATRDSALINNYLIKIR